MSLLKMFITLTKLLMLLMLLKICLILPVRSPSFLLVYVPAVLVVEPVVVEVVGMVLQATTNNLKVFQQPSVTAWTSPGLGSEVQSSVTPRSAQVPFTAHFHHH